MAIKPTVYTLQDPDTGEEYKIEGPDDATDDELIGALQEHLAAPQSSPAATTPVAAPAPVRGQAVVGEGKSDLPAAYVAPARANIEGVMGDGFDKAAAQADPDWMGAEERTKVAKLMADPNIPYADINDYVKQLAVAKGYPGSGLTGGEQQLNDYRKAIASGQSPVQDVSYTDWTNTLKKPEASVQTKEDPEANLIEKGQNYLTRGYQEAVQYGAPGWLARTYQDWVGTGMDQLKQRFPDATPDQLEAMQEGVINWTQNQLRQANQIETENDPLIPWLAGQIIGGAGPEDLVPFMGAASLAGRAAKSAALNGVADVAWQGADIAAGVQDKFNPVQALAAPLIGGAFHLGMEGVSAGARALKPEARPDVAPEVSGETLTKYLAKQEEPKVTGTLRQRNKDLKEMREAAVTEATEHVAKVMEGWTNAPEFEVVSSWKDIKDPEVRANLEDDAVGAFTPDGKMLINLKNVRNGADLTAVAFHESLGHHGMAQRFQEDLDRILDDIYSNGLDSVQKKTDDWLAKNPEEYKDRTPEERRRLATEEVLAGKSEGGRLPVTVKDKVSNLVKETARAAGVPLKISQREVDSILAMAHQAVVSGVKGNPRINGYRYSKKVWHGTGATFTNKDEENPYGAFDHDYMSSGEGAQVFGWGTYVTESRGIGEGYRDKLGETDTSWNGVSGPLYNVRRAASQDVVAKFSNLMEPEEIIPLSDSIFELMAGVYERPTKNPTVKQVAQYSDIGSAQDPEFAAIVHDMIGYMQNRFERKTKGSLYEVEIPDGPYLDWDKPLTENRKEAYALEEGLREAGLEVESYDNWNYLERQYYDARTKYRNLSHELDSLNDLIENETKYPGPDAKNLPDYIARADDLFPKVQQAVINLDKWKKEVENVVHEDMDGQTIYNRLAGKLGSPKKASKQLADYGIEGVRYPANSISGNGMTKADGSPVYNYVIFDDASPKIVNKYSKRRTLREENDYQIAVRRVADFWNISNIAKAEKERDFRAEVKMELTMAGKDQSLVDRESAVVANTKFSKRNTTEVLDLHERRIKKYEEYLTKPPSKVSLNELDEAINYLDEAYAQGRDVEKLQDALTQMELAKYASRTPSNDDKPETLEQKVFRMERELHDFGFNNEDRFARRNTKAYKAYEAKYAKMEEEFNKVVKEWRGGDNSDSYITYDNGSPVKNKFSKKRKVERDEASTISAAREILDAITEGYTPEVRSWAEARSDAQRKGLSRKQINQSKGVGQLDVKLHQYEAVADATNTKLTELHEKMDSGTFSVADKHKYLATLAEQSNLMGVIFNDHAEIARALHAMKQLNYTKNKLNALNEVLADMQGSGFKALADDGIFREFADQVRFAMASGNQAAVTNLTKTVLKPYWWQYLLSFRHSMMLSGLGTQAKNTTDSALMIARELEETALALPGFAIRKGLQKAGVNVKDGVSPQELAGRSYGLIRALLDGQTYKNTGTAFMEGHGNTVHSSKVETQDARIPVVSKVQDLLHASDTFFRAFHRNANLYTLGVRKAREQGFTGLSAFEEGTNLAHNPTEEMLKEAGNMTDMALLIDKPSALAARLEPFKAIRPGMSGEEQAVAFAANLAFPFFRVSDRLIYQKLRRAGPLAYLDRVTREDIAAGGARMDVAIARATYGAALLYYYWQAAGEDKVTGSGPVDYDKKLALEAGGHMENAVKEDGKYVDASALNLSFMPTDLQNSVATNVASIRKAYDKEKNAGDTAAAYGMAFKALLVELSSQSFAENISLYTTPFKEQPEATFGTSVANLGGSLASSFVPAAMRQYNAVYNDPVKRDTTGDKSISDRIAGRVMSGIPGLSDNLPVKYDVYGDEQPTGRSISGMDNYRDIKTDPFSTEMQSLEKSTDKPVVLGVPSSFEYEGETIKLPADAKQEWQRVQGYYLKYMVGEEMKTPEYKAMSVPERVERIKEIRKDAYDETKAYMLPLLGLE